MLVLGTRAILGSLFPHLSVDLGVSSTTPSKSAAAPDTGTMHCAAAADASRAVYIWATPEERD